MSRIPAGTYSIDPAHTSIEFGVRHMMISTVKGRFGEVSGTVVIPESGQPRADVTIATGSIDTRSEQRDTHLRSGDFFEVEKYPGMRFVSTKAERSGDGWKVTGDLTIRDVTRPITLDVKEEGSAVDPWGNQKVAFSATGTLVRSAYGLNWNAALETGGVLVSDEVKLFIDVQLIRQAEAKVA